MSNKTFEAIELALNNLNSTAEKLIFAPESEVVVRQNTIKIENNFSTDNALALIGDVKYIGIVNAEKFNTQSITNLINILTTENEATVITLSYNPVSCMVFYPTPKIGTKIIDDNYEYSYRQGYCCDLWLNISDQNGWGVRVVDNTKTDYGCPLTAIQGYPVTNMMYLFYRNPSTSLNLIDWNTSNVTDMTSMFGKAQATHLVLHKFDTSSVTTMKGMFAHSKATSLDLSDFDTSKVTSMHGMFFRSKTTSLDLSSFDTYNVTEMTDMFFFSNATIFDLSSFDTSCVINSDNMFNFGCSATIMARSRADTNRYLKSGGVHVRIISRNPIS